MMDYVEVQKRTSIVEACRWMLAQGLSHGTSGNISIRNGDRLLITPSGVPCDRMSPEEIVEMEFNGNWHGALRPSSEWRFHIDILNSRKDVNAVVHCHPVYATSLAICGREIPAIHYMIAAAGGENVRCAKYATFGTQKLSDNVLAAIQGRNCCLLANHGMIATGVNLERALWLAAELENLAQQYVISLSIGHPLTLSGEEIEKNIELFKHYGPKEISEK